MKLGVAGLLPSDWRAIDRAAAQQVRAAGFQGAQLFIHDPLAALDGEVLRVRQAFAAGGLEIAQVNGWYECLVNPDLRTRAEGVQGLQALVRVGALVGSRTVYVRPGSLNAEGHWWPHPENHSAATFDRLIESLKQVCRTAQAEGVTLAIEGHVLSPLDSAQRVRDLLDAVNSPVLKFNIDPVNFIGSVQDVYHPTRVLNELFDLLGKDTVVGHAKDCALENALVLHIEEVVAGTGFLDYGTFLTRFQTCCPDGYLLIEHLPDEKVPPARQAILAVAERLNIPMLIGA